MFKSYTRKSSAKIGAERAGLTEADLVQVDGKWGFYEPGTEPKKVLLIEPGTPWRDESLDRLAVDLFDTGPNVIITDRRKVLRLANRARKNVSKVIKMFGDDSQADGPGILQTLKALRQSYRKAGLQQTTFVDA